MHEEHGHQRRGRTAATRWWRVESDAGAVERKRERESGAVKNMDLGSNRAVIR
jgi:hypothetical protein